MFTEKLLIIIYKKKFYFKALVLYELKHLKFYYSKCLNLILSIVLFKNFHKEIFIFF